MKAINHELWPDFAEQNHNLALNPAQAELVQQLKTQWQKGWQAARPSLIAGK